MRRRFFGQAALIVGLSAAIGLAVNLPLVKRLLKGELDLRFLSEKEFSGVILIALPEAEDLFAGNGGFFVDARPQTEFESGHIPGAKNWPLEEAKGDIRLLAAGISSDKKPVIYCSGGDCLASLNLAKILSAHGIKEVRVFLGGWAEWKNAGLPEEQGNDKK